MRLSYFGFGGSNQNFVLRSIYFWLIGLRLVVWALIYAMSSWLMEPFRFFRNLINSTQNLLIGLFIAIVGALLVGSLKGSFIERALVLSETLKDKNGFKDTGLTNSALVGKKGMSLTRLNPSGLSK